MRNTSPQRDEMATLIEQLAQAAATVAKDDLSVLAKMHGWCEVLVEGSRPNAPQACPRTYEAARAMTRALEGLILGEAPDPDQALATVREVIGTLGGATPAAGDGGDAPSTEESDADVAAKLAAIFVEDAPAAPAVSESAADQAATAPLSAGGGAELNKASASAAPAIAPYVAEPLVIGPKEIEFVKGFVEEAREHIEAIETAVLEVERAPEDSAKIDDLFRPFHTIKGMAGFLNLRDVNCLAHEVETLLDQGRKGQRKITSELIDLILEAVDVLKVQIDGIAGHLAAPGSEPVPQPPAAGIIMKLRGVAAGQSRPVADAGVAPAAARPTSKPPTSSASSLAAAPASGPAGAERGRDEKAPEPTRGAAVRPDAPAETEGSTAGAAEPGAGAAAGGRNVVGDQSVRIETAKLDALVDMVGELVIAQTLVAASPKIAADAKLSKDVDQVAKIVRDVQEVAMAMRMIPIGATFQRMARLVRDVSRKAGKQVELIISGEETELDKNVIQQIGDPLVHMVRNAVDHGIESPDERRRIGKNPVGNVYLSAFHQGGNIIIQIRDDGAGLDPERLIAKGREKGLVRPDEDLTVDEAYALIFAPGFSTAAQITDISGRGVGMDVVRRNIEQLRGRVEIASEKGHGSTFSICLPLTLAIIDGMVLKVANERFILPTIAIQQALRPTAEQIATVQQRGELVVVRGRLIPLVQLGELFGLCGRVDPCGAMVIVAHCDGRQIGLVVEELIGQQQVVIKTLGERFVGLRGISGAAILGDGRVGLILETTGLAAAYSEWRPGALREATGSEAAVATGHDAQAATAPAADAATGAPKRVETAPLLVTAGA
jgi:two-component system, chemotaxis family, sensor kinase CheA